MANKPRVHIVVLGDLGRSPRMSYHAWSFSQEGWRVQMTGYAGTRQHHAVSRNADIEITPLGEPPEWTNHLWPRALVYAVKVVFVFLLLLWRLLRAEWSPVLMLQTPPAVPTFAAAWIAAKLRGIQLVVDWHNYGYTIMALSVGNKSLLTRLYEVLECWFACRFLQHSLHFCVSSALKADLKMRWKVSAKTLHDRPAPKFRRASLLEMHRLFAKLSADHPAFLPGPNLPLTSTRITSATHDEAPVGDVDNQLEVSLRRDRPALVVSSSSWTADDRVDLLLEALDAYDHLAVDDEAGLPHLLCILTGRGPLKSFYQDVIAGRVWHHVEVVMPWLEPEDYPLLLGSCDLGVCLHNSSSGLDLPMKVVDMFGAELPVCVLHYQCIEELVVEGETGRLFHSSSQLAGQLADLLGPLVLQGEGGMGVGEDAYPPAGCELARFRGNIAQWRQDDWHHNWRRVVLPRLNSLIR